MRKKYSSTFKAKVALEALQERESLSELAVRYGVHPQMIIRWKKEFLERAPELFSKSKPDKQHYKDLDKLYAKIGQLEMEKEFLKIT